MHSSRLTVALAASALFAGCGGSDFQAEAQKVCARYAERIAAVDRPADLKQLAGTSGQIAELIDQQVGELRKLEAPGDQADGFARWLRLTTEAAANARALQTAADAGDQTRVNELAGEAARNTLSADRLARDLEIPDCMVESEGASGAGR